MKSITKLSICLIISILVSSFASDVYAGIENNRGKSIKTNKRIKPKNPRAIGAPLDGGLLAALGVAGVGYYLVRKKKKNS